MKKNNLKALVLASAFTTVFAAGAQAADQLDAGNQTIINVGAGAIEENSTDAVTGGQVYNVQKQLDEVKGKADKVLNEVGSAASTDTATGTTTAATGLFATVDALDKANTATNARIDSTQADVKKDIDNLTKQLGNTNDSIKTNNDNAVKLVTDRFNELNSALAQQNTDLNNSIVTKVNDVYNELGKEIKDTYGTMATQINDTRSRISTTTVSAGNNVTVEKTSSTDADGFAINDYKVSLSDEVNVNKITADQGTIKNLQLGSDGDALSLTKNGNNISYTTPDGTNNTVLTDKNLKAGDGIAISQDGAGNTVISNTQQMDLEGVKANVRENAKEIRKVGAGAAALAGLHPVDFDPDYKFNMAVAGGGYRNEKALALGAFYRPNDNIMFSAATTVGNGENMYNVGASWKFGTSAKKVKDADLKSMQNQIDELRNMVNNLAQENHALRLANQRASFPDVPADHWANEAVEVLHGNNVLTGYPDGNFHGDRPMTRYEYAQMLYKTADKITQ